MVDENLAVPLNSNSHALKDLQLSKIIRENHGKDVIACKFFRSKKSDDNSDKPVNLLATIGGSQANIYDNMHCDTHLDIVAHFNLEGEKFVCRDLIQTCCCWIECESDLLLAIGSESGAIHIVSVSFSAEIKRLRHEVGIVDIGSVGLLGNELVTLDANGVISIWNIDSGTWQSIGTEITAMVS
jgi:WD40 repeat protein